MASADITATTITVRLSTAEKISAMRGDLVIPRSAVRNVDVVEDAIAATSGLRAPGLGLPGFRMIGTWRKPGHREFVSVRRGQPAVRVTLSGQPFDALLIGSDNARALAADITAAATA